MSNLRVRDIINILSRYAEQNPIVMCQYELTFTSLNEENFYMSPRGTLIIDADDNFYRDRIISGDITEYEDMP